jgi:hypothetical protein
MNAELIEKKEQELKDLICNKEKQEFLLYKTKTAITQAKRIIKNGGTEGFDKTKVFEIKWKKSLEKEDFYRMKAKHLTFRLLKELVNRKVKTKDMALVLGCSKAKVSSLRPHLKHATSYTEPGSPGFIDFDERYHSMMETVKEIESGAGGENEHT